MSYPSGQDNKDSMLRHDPMCRYLGLYNGTAAPLHNYSVSSLDAVTIDTDENATDT